MTLIVNAKKKSMFAYIRKLIKKDSLHFRIILGPESALILLKNTIANIQDRKGFLKFEKKVKGKEYVD